MEHIGKLAQAIETLRESGQTGFWLLSILIVAVLVVLTVAFILQRSVISRNEQMLRSVDAKIKSVEIGFKDRELGVKERDELRAIFNQQFDVVKNTNGELRTEISRLRDQQKSMKDSINGTITHGLENLKERISQTSLREIVAQIPDSIREEMSAEFQKNLNIALEKLRDRIDSADFKEHIERALEKIPDQFGKDFVERLGGMIRSDFSDYVSYAVLAGIREAVYWSVARHCGEAAAKEVVRDLQEHALNRTPGLLRRW